jgi:hypothetical protein
MRRVASSRFLIWVACILAAYWSAGTLNAYPDYFSGTISAYLLVFSGLVCAQWGTDAIRMVVDSVKDRRQIDRGEELSLVGVALLSAGAFYQAMFALTWVIIGQPSAWLGTASSGFGRFVMASGFLMMFISPLKVPKGAFDKMSWWALGPVILMVIAMSFVLGSQWGAKQEGRAAFKAGMVAPLPSIVPLAPR